MTGSKPLPSSPSDGSLPVLLPSRLSSPMPTAQNPREDTTLQERQRAREQERAHRRELEREREHLEWFREHERAYRARRRQERERVREAELARERAREEELAREHERVEAPPPPYVRGAIRAEVDLNLLDIASLSLSAIQNSLNNDNGPPPYITLRTHAAATDLVPSRQPLPALDRSNNTGRAPATSSRRRHDAQNSGPTEFTEHVSRSNATTTLRNANEHAGRSSNASTRSSNASSRSSNVSGGSLNASTASSTARAPPPTVASSTAASSTDTSSSGPCTQPNIRQIDEDEGGIYRRWHVVTRGKGKIGVFRTWLRAAPYCSGIHGAHYEGYSTRAQALRAFYEAESEGQTGFL